jgi:hypothetical protein
MKPRKWPTIMALAGVLMTNEAGWVGWAGVVLFTFAMFHIDNRRAA